MLNTVSSGCSRANGTRSFELKASLISLSFMPPACVFPPKDVSLGSLRCCDRGIGDEGKRESCPGASRSLHGAFCGRHREARLSSGARTGADLGLQGSIVVVIVTILADDSRLRIDCQFSLTPVLGGHCLEYAAPQCDLDIRDALRR
jgi:hypothetical protein